MELIDVWTDELVKANYFTTAKGAVYGKKAFLKGAKYQELQQVLNDWVRLERGTWMSSENKKHPFLVWNKDAPSDAPNMYDARSFNPRLQRFIDLTYRGRERLQEVLTNHYGEYQLKA
jgi:hypothetical protein